MPQLFQVLKCFKCSVFQVHQTKKSNKYECKLCGEKQSIKRHYGLGTGKECRLHVQKLNGIRGEVDEINDKAKIAESSDEEIPEKNDTSTSDNKHAFKSKWSDFVNKTEDVKVPEPEPVYIGNAEVVLEVPAKRPKFTKPKVKLTKNLKNTLIPSAYPSKTNCYDNVQDYLETQTSNVGNNLQITNSMITTNNTNGDQIMRKNRDIPELKPRPEIKSFVPHKVDKNSKWMQYADESEEENQCEEDLISPINIENTPVTNTDIEQNSKVIPKNLTNNIFSLCDEDDIDDILCF